MHTEPNANTPRPSFKEDRLDRTQAADFLGLKESTLEADVSTKRLGIPFYKLGRRVFYRRSELELWVQSRRHGARPQAIPVYPKPEAA